MSVLQIVPTLPPPPEGVGSYSTVLDRALRQYTAWESEFLVCNPGWPRRPSPHGVLRLASRDPNSLESALDGWLDLRSQQEPAAILLHYANYGYAPRGCPEWLVRGLERWHTRHPDVRIVTLFHELFATAPPWRSSFWLGPKQRAIASRVATTSDSTATTLDLYAQLLKRLGTNADPAVLPILSSVGEPRNPAPLRDRSRRLVVFGGAGARRRGYALGEPLRKACQALEIEEVLDIGPPVDRLPSRGPGVPIRSTGALRTEEVGALLGESMAGFLVYPSEFLPKSTIFAAYCAHGMLPICASSRPQGPSADGPPYWRPTGGGASSARLNPDEAQVIADRALAWYQPHRAEMHAALFERLLTISGEGGPLP